MNAHEPEHTDYTEFLNEAVDRLSEANHIVLATSVSDKVTARTMSHVNTGLMIMFQTGENSEKAAQIMANPNVAFAVRNMQIEAVAKIAGRPTENELFINLYRQKFPDAYAKYTNLPDEILIIANPKKISFYKYADGKPFRHICLISDKKVYTECVL